MIVLARRAAQAASLSAVFVFGGFLAGCATSAPPPPAATILSSGWQLQDVAKAPENGQIISKSDYATANWYKATVPGTVLTSLVNDGVYPEPLYGENNRPDRIPESLCRTSYWYRTPLTVPAAYAGRHVWLNLDGINYIAQIWINGQQIGEIHGAFSRGVFDITPLVKPGVPATLAVRIDPPPHPGTHAEKTVAHGTGPNGGILTEDGATFLCSLGWDWIPTIRDRDIGIWQNVWLSATGPVRLQDPMVSSDIPLPRTDTADLTVQVRLSNISGSRQSGVLHGQSEAANFAVPITLGAHESRLVTVSPATVGALRVSNPRLWWPNGYGDPNLYAMHLSFDSDGISSDACDFSFGIRKIAYQLPGSENLAISVNGVPVLCKGGDWGMDEAMKRIPRSRLEAQIRMHQEANFNMIRNWVGQSTGEDFYDMCDKYGIMVWDEFFQPNPSDGPNVLDTDMYLANVREKVLRFRNHPCIALWCGRNEGDPPPLVDRGIRQIVNELNPQRLYQPNSRDGKGVRSGGPYAWRPPRQFYVFPVSEAFKTEIGSVSVPTIESVHAMMPQKDWETVNDDWAEHDMTRGAQEGVRRPMYPAIIAQRYGTVANLADFVRKAQLANYEAFRAMYEGRNAKLFHPSTGVLTWMSNSSQPTFVWQIYSHDLEANSALFASRKACEPVHIQMNQSDFHVMVINNRPSALNGLEADIDVFNLDGSKKYANHLTLSAPASAACDLGLLAFPAGLSPVHFVKLELRDHGRLVSDNFYWRADPAHQDDLAAMERLPIVSLDAVALRRDEPGKFLVDVTLSNPTPAIAVMAHLQLHRGGDNQRVLPVYYSDNYVSLLPGEARTITIEAAASDLQGQPPRVLIDGWNISTDAKSFAGVDVALNEEAQVTSSPINGFNAGPTTSPSR